MNRTFITLAAAALILPASSFAQQSTPAARKNEQQQRIANGVQSGQLTAGETKRLETRETGINAETHRDRAANGGKLTTQERRQISRQQNRVSRSIYTDKHNAATAHYGNNRVGQRRENQQDRIANGIRSGSMTTGEAARTEGRQQRINRSVAHDRAANGGRLTSGERRNINRRQNRASRQIYRQKHNARRR